MNEKISYIKLPNITTSKLQDVVDFLDDNEIEYVEYYAEDLQNRIDKAIKFIEKNSKQCLTNKIDEQPTKVIGKFMWHIDDLLDILKESGE